MIKKLLPAVLMVMSGASLSLAQPSDTGSQAGQWTDTAKSEMANRVRQEFLHAWDSYKQYAWGHDELRPLSKGYYDWYGQSLLMTPVDALDTMLLMGLTDEANADRQLIDTKLSFDKDISVKVFEINIRMMGGLLSSYQLSGDTNLLNLAQDLGNRLLPAFDSPTGMPYRYVNLKTGAVSGTDSNPAEIGTYLIEFGTLSKLTGNPIYYEKAKHAAQVLYDRRSKIGLVGVGIDIRTGQWTDPDSSVTGGIDSYYEYLLKSWLLFGDKDCKRMWDTSLKALDKYSADNAPSGFWYGHVNMDTGARTGTYFGALDAYFPGELALAGHLKHADRLETSCYKMWNVAGIEPEVLDYSNMKIVNPAYPLRPEIIESDYYLYHFTGDDRYLNMGQTFFDNLVKYCRTDVAYASLSNVETKEKTDDMESFFFAEVLKYLYLLYAPQSTVDLHKAVFNTEAHPMQRTWAQN